MFLQLKLSLCFYCSSSEVDYGPFISYVCGRHHQRGETVVVHRGTCCLSFETMQTSGVFNGVNP